MKLTKFQGSLLILLGTVLSLAVVASTGYLQSIAPKVDPTAEVRQCGEPARDADGDIHRSSAVIYAFRKLHPCPVNGSRFGACPKWSINHVIPLASGGCDSVSNMQWLPNQIKSCSSDWCVDRWERTYWGNPHGLVVIND